MPFSWTPALRRPRRQRSPSHQNPSGSQEGETQPLPPVAGIFATSLERSILRSKVITDWPETRFLELYNCYRFAKHQGLPIFLQHYIETFSWPMDLRLSMSNHLWLWGLDPPPSPSQTALMSFSEHMGVLPHTRLRVGPALLRAPSWICKLTMAVRRHESALRWKERKWNPNQALKALLEPSQVTF